MTTRRDQQYTQLENMPSRGVRREAGDDEPITTIGYVPGSDKARAVPGDEDFPYFKDPTDVRGPFVLLDGVPPLADPLSPSLADYADTIEIDVRGQRTLVLVLTYTPSNSGGVGSGTLSLIPQARLEATPGEAAAWATIGVVDPTLNTPAIGQSYAYRNIHATELRLNPFVNLTPPFPAPAAITMTLVFDVSGYRDFRFRYADLLGATSTLKLDYYLQR